MLPRIDPQQRHILPDNGILIRIRDHFDRIRLRILDQPRPPAALDPRQLRIHHFLQPLHPPVRVVDCSRESARWRTPAAEFSGGEVLPEEGVVEVAAAVEVDEGLQGNFLGGGDGGVEFLGGGVVAVHVGLVVLRVVELHYLPGDGGFEGGVVIWFVECNCQLRDAFAGKEWATIRTWEVRESSFGGYGGCGGWLDGLLAEVVHSTSEGASGYGRAEEGGGHFYIVNGLMEAKERVEMLPID